MSRDNYDGINGIAKRTCTSFLNQHGEQTVAYGLFGESSQGLRQDSLVSLSEGQAYERKDTDSFVQEDGGDMSEMSSVSTMSENDRLDRAQASSRHILGMTRTVSTMQQQQQQQQQTPYTHAETMANSAIAEEEEQVIAAAIATGSNILESTSMGASGHAPVVSENAVIDVNAAAAAATSATTTTTTTTTTTPTTMVASMVSLMDTYSDKTQLCELIRSLRLQELKQHRFHPVPSHLKYRRMIVDWMCEFGDVFTLFPATIHIAIKYLDRTLSRLVLPKNRLQVVAMACMLIAAKFEESESVVPSVASLKTCCGNIYTEADILSMEGTVLTELNWRLAVATPVHFLGIYVHEGVVFENDIIDNMPACAKAVRYVRKYVDFFAELHLQEYSLQEFLPSITAAAIVACSRRAVKLEPIWNPQLEALTGYSERDIYKCYKTLYDYYLVSFPTVPSAASPKCIEDFEAAAGYAH